MAGGAIDRIGGLHDWLEELASGKRTATGIASPVKVRISASHERTLRVVMAIRAQVGVVGELSLGAARRTAEGEPIEIPAEFVETFAAVVEGAGGEVEVLS